MRSTMEVNNVSIDERDDIYRNYFLEVAGDPYDDVPLPVDVREGMCYLECNKRTNLSCVAALDIDVMNTTR